MESQAELSLVHEVDNTIRDKKHQKKTAQELNDYPDDYCFKIIESEPYLWDMRCWDKYHDREEIMTNLQKEELDYLNAGHCVFCIRLLKERGLPLEEIAEAMLRNNNIQYKNRLVKCFDENELEKCTLYKEHGYSKCKECE